MQKRTPERLAKSPCQQQPRGNDESCRIPQREERIQERQSMDRHKSPESKTCSEGPPKVLLKSDPDLSGRTVHANADRILPVDTYRELTALAPELSKTRVLEDLRTDGCVTAHELVRLLRSQNAGAM